MNKRSLLLLGVPALCNALTVADANNIIGEIRSLRPNGGGNNALGDYFGELVRLSFHDCAGNGGCNGCFQANLDDHRGLGPIADDLENIFDRHQNAITRADLFALAGTVAVFDSGGPSIPFTAGRVDCDNAALQDDTDHLPLADPAGDTWTHVLDVFVTRMGFTERDVVALMGAHTLGRAETANSGFNGAWVNGSPHAFTNEFYQDILGRRWNQRNQGGGTVWTAGGNTIMLDTDMAIMVDPDDQQCNTVGGGGGGGNLRNCRRNPTAAPIAEEYIANQNAWFRDFSTAWVKMLHLGSSNLEPTVFNVNNNGVTVGTTAPPTVEEPPAANPNPPQGGGGRQRGGGDGGGRDGGGDGGDGRDGRGGRGGGGGRRGDLNGRNRNQEPETAGLVADPDQLNSEISAVAPPPADAAVVTSTTTSDAYVTSTLIFPLWAAGVWACLAY